MKRKITSILLFTSLLISPSGAYEFSEPLQVSSNSTTNAQYPAVDLDDAIVEDTSPYVAKVGNAHIVWTEEGDPDEWHTNYRVVDPFEVKSVIETVHREDICGTVYIDHISEVPTTPDIRVDNVRDLADICFRCQNVDWYYSAEPENPARELLFVPRKDYVWTSGSVVPSPFHHISGLQKMLCDPRIFPMKAGPTTAYMFGVIWSQWDAYSNESYSPRHLYQCQAKANQPTHIDWGEQTRSSEDGYTTGQNPYGALGVNRANYPAFSNTDSPYLLAVVSHNNGTIYCSLARLLGMGESLTWKTISFPSGGLTPWTYSMPTCCFTNDPVEPELLVAFRAYNGSGEPVVTKYLVYEVEDAWTSSPSFAASPLYEITGDDVNLPEAPPVIAINAFDKRGIAYIGPDSNAYITIRSMAGSETIQLSGDDKTSSETRWIDLAVDQNTLKKHGAYIGGDFCVVFDGEDSENNRHIYLSRQE